MNPYLHVLDEPWRYEAIEKTAEIREEMLAPQNFDVPFEWRWFETGPTMRERLAHL